MILAHLFHKKKNHSLKTKRTLLERSIEIGEKQTNNKMYNISGKLGRQSPLKIRNQTLDTSNMNKFKSHP